MKCKSHFYLLFIAVLAGSLSMNPPVAAQTSTMFVEGDAVGIGTDGPGSTSGFGGVPAKLHVRTTTDTDGSLIVENASTSANQRVLMELRNNGNVDFSLVNTSGESWRFQNFEGDFRVTKAGTGVGELTVDANGNLTITGALYTAGSCSTGCDRVFDAGYDIDTIEEHAAAMWAGKHLPEVGPTPEAGTVNISQKTLGILNELEKAHIYIEQLHKRLEEKEASLTELRNDNADLGDRLARLEQYVGLEQSVRRDDGCCRGNASAK